jgi:hypothetical protein
MKKLVLSLAAIALATTVSAQGFTITVGGNTVENGSTVINGDFVEELLQFGMYQIDPKVYVTSDTDCTGSIQIEAVEGNGAQICAFGNCVPVATGKTVVKTGDMEAGVPVETQIESVSSMTREGTYVKTVISVWNNDLDEEDDSAVFKFTLIMDGEAGVAKVLTSDAVNFANNAINYDLTNGSVEIYTVGGALVKSAKVSGAGSIDLSTLPSALYVYRVKDGKKVATGKALIK